MTTTKPPRTGSRRKYPPLSIAGVPPEMREHFYRTAQRAGKTFSDWARDLMIAGSGYRAGSDEKS